MGDYRYTVRSGDEQVQIVFLDCSRDLNGFRTFLIISGQVCVVGLIGVFLLLFILSGRIVKPFSENYEKQKRFITDAGHELKTPLTIIDADAEVLEMDFGENEWLRDIQTQTKRLADLTNSLIMLSRMEEEQGRTETITFPLSDVAEETLETFQTLARTHRKTLTGQIQPMISMSGDEKAIRRLISILLDNAVKYSQEEGRISLTPEKQKTSSGSVCSTLPSSFPKRVCPICLTGFTGRTSPEIPRQGAMVWAFPSRRPSSVPTGAEFWPPPPTSSPC